MPIEGFDYKAFAIDLARQALEILAAPNSNAAPSTLDVNEKKLIVETVKKFCTMAGEALSNDVQIKLTAEQASLITQFIGEWTFHKSIDLIKGKVPKEFHEQILQIIAANIFNTAKLAIIKKMPQDTIVNLVEDKVKLVYNEEIQKLVKKGALSAQQGEIATKASNLNEMVQKTEDEAKIRAAKNPDQQAKVPATNDKKVLKLAALAIVLKKLPEEKVKEILTSINQQDAQHVINYMKMTDLEDKIDHKIIINSLQEIKKLLPTANKINTQKILKKYHESLKHTPIDVLSKISLQERDSVKDFILDVNFPAEETFSPHVIKALVKSIEEKINDN